jgi:pilus assembly protein CpaE
MSEKIRVLIVDDIPETRENVRKLLQFESDLEVIGHAGTGDEAIQMTKQQKPDVVLMDINMPDADGISATQIVTKTVPGAQVIIMSVQSEADYLRRAMLAGARDFLMKPFSGDELVGAVRRVHETRPTTAVTAGAGQLTVTAGPGQPRLNLRHGKVITVFSPKGGIGCTTVAINVAVALAEAGNETLLVDGSLQFGDVAVMLNLKSLTSIVDIIDRMSELDSELVSSVMVVHEDSGLKVLPAPSRPEMAEMVTADELKALLRALRDMYDYIIVDTSSSLNDENLAILDEADRILLMTRQNLPSLKNVSRFFDLSEDLEYERSKVILVVNHGSNKHNISVKDVEDTLKWPASAVIPEEEVAYSAADQGKPLVQGAWRKRPGSKALLQLTQRLIVDLENEAGVDETAQPNGASRLSRLFRK